MIAILFVCFLLTGAIHAQVCSVTTTNKLGQTVRFEKLCSCGCCNVVSLCCDCKKRNVVTNHSGGTTAGIVIGTILAVGAVVALLFVIWIKCKRPRREVSGSSDVPVVALDMVQPSSSRTIQRCLAASSNHHPPSNMEKMPLPSSDISRGAPSDTDRTDQLLTHSCLMSGHRRTAPDTSMDDPPQDLSDFVKTDGSQDHLDMQSRQDPSEASRDDTRGLPPVYRRMDLSDFSKIVGSQDHSDMWIDQPHWAPSKASRYDAHGPPPAYRSMDDPPFDPSDLGKINGSQDPPSMQIDQPRQAPSDASRDHTRGPPHAYRPVK